MKHVKLMIAGIALLCISRVNAQIPNGNFEEWETIRFGLFQFEMAKNWMGGNIMSALWGKPMNVTKTTDSYAGAYAIKFENFEDTSEFKMPSMVSTIIGNPLESNQFKFPVYGKPTALTGYFKYQSPDEDSFLVMITLYKGDQTIGDAIFTTATNTNTYLQFNAEINYFEDDQPDSASMTIISSQTQPYTVGTTLWLDELSLVGGTSTFVSNYTKSDFDMITYPNPVVNELSIKFKAKENVQISANICDITGKTVLAIPAQHVAKGNQEISIKHLALKPGIYFVTIESAQGYKASQKIIVQ